MEELLVFLSGIEAIMPTRKSPSLDPWPVQRRELAASELRIVSNDERKAALLLQQSRKGKRRGKKGKNKGKSNVKTARMNDKLVDIALFGCLENEKEKKEKKNFSVWLSVG